MRTSIGAVFAALAAVWATAGVAANGAEGASPPAERERQTLRWHVAVVPAQAKPGETVDVVFTADIAEGWILYSSNFELEIGPRPAKFTFDANPALTLVGPILAVDPQWKKDPTLDGATYSYFSKRAEFRQKAKVVSPLQTVSGRIDGQTCFEKDGLCELFREKFSASVTGAASSKDVRAPAVAAFSVAAPASTTMPAAAAPTRAGATAALGSASTAPAVSPSTPAQLAPLRVELGRKLFFDPLLSKDRSVSCATCHKPERAFADDLVVSKGVGGALGTRNTPSVMNASGRTALFWDGRAETLEEQALGPIENPVEMALSLTEALARINADPVYAAQFQAAYNGPATARTLGRAIAAYEKTLDTTNSPYDRFSHGDDAAISESAKRGRLLFIGRAKCADCHSGEDFTSDRFRNVGLFDGAKFSDRGRGAITNQPQEDGEFKVPSLRNVAVTAPYMHNGIFRTLREVIDYYNEPDQVVPNAKGRDAAMNLQMKLSEQDKVDLEAFLESLTDDRFRAGNAAPAAVPSPRSQPTPG